MHCKRLGVFVFYDKDGIVDGYIDYLLNDLSNCLDKLIVVCNGALNEQGKQFFLKYTNDVFLRENVGFDAAAWQYVLIEKFGIEHLDDYDELVLLNDTFYGPFYSFAEVFEQMKEKDVDFWGLTIHGKTFDGWGLCEYGYLPEHIQSYFTVYKEKLIHSDVFKDYWRNLPVAKSFEEAVCSNEARQTKYFSDLGFKYGVLCDTRGLEDGYGYSDCHYIYNPLMLIKTYKCPVLKRKTLITDKAFLLKVNHAIVSLEALNYIKYNTSYDVNLICKYLIRTVDPLLLKQTLNLNYIIDDTVDKAVSAKTAIVAKITREASAKVFLSYLKNAKGIADYFIFTSSSVIKEMCVSELGKNKLQFLTNTGNREELFFWESISQELKQYDLIGTFDDCMFMEGEGRVFSADLAVADVAWGNLLKSRRFIDNIIYLFENNECLGILTHPLAYNGSNLPSLSNPWQIDSSTKEQNKDIVKYEPIFFSANMWFSNKALECFRAVVFSRNDINNRQLVLNQLPYELKTVGMYAANVASAEFMAATSQNNFVIMHNLGVLPNVQSLEFFKLLLKVYLPDRVVLLLKKIRSLFRSAFK